MSSSSLYEPDEDEEASDSDFENRAPRQGFAASSPPLQGLRIGSSDESEGENTKSRRRSRSSRGTRTNAHRSRRRGYTKETIDSYRQMLTDMINDVSAGPKFEDGDTHHPSQIGAVTWSSSEKETFFNLLARKGKDGIEEISNAIGTKTKLEVLDYIRLLQTGLERQHLLERHTRTIVLGDVPAATEVGPECCEALDEIAEILALEEQASENTSGRRMHGDDWIIDRESAEQVEEQLEAQENADGQAKSSIALSASLLNISKWIKLSERFFMNFGGSRIEDNWVNLAYEDESPSLTSEAFADFYALAVSITRRLVQSSLFFAMSRIRDVSWSNREIARAVRPRDVRAALDVLNMKYDTFEFWIGVARRCNLDVADIRHRKGWVTDYMSYEEIETALSGSVASRERSVSQRPSEYQTQDIDEMEKEEEDAEDMSEVLSSPGSGSHSPSLVSEGEEIVSDSENLEDTHAEYVDQQSSRAEELHIWKMLKQSGPSIESPIKLEDGDQIPDSTAPRKPTGERKRKEELVDWRDRTLYRSEWEEYGYEIFEIEDKLDQNRRKRRRVEDTVANRSSASQVQKLRENIDHDNSHQDKRSRTRAEDTADTSENYTEEENENEEVELDYDSSDGGMELDPAPAPEANIHSADHDHDAQSDREGELEDESPSAESRPPFSSDHEQLAFDQGEDIHSSISASNSDDEPLPSYPLSPRHETDDSE